jgi:glucokinase
MTLAELRLGAGRGARDALCIALGTGVGGGMVIGGRLHLGTAHAGELGHVCVDPEGARCGCGNRGCLDRMASADAIAAMGGRATVGAVIEAARGGDARALAGLREAAGVIAVGLGSAIALLWPERVIVGGGVAEAGELLLGPLRDALRERAAVVPADTYDLVRAALGPFAGAAGAALWAAEAQGDGAA